MSGRGESTRLLLTASELESLQRVARQHGATLFVILLSAYVLLLMRLSGTRDLLVGTPVRGREQPELLGLMGFFVNALPLRFQRGNPTLAQWIAQVRGTVQEALGNADVPFDALVRQINPRRDPSRPLLFQTLFSFQDVRERLPAWGPLQHQRFPEPIKGSSHELSLWCVQTREGMEAIFTVASDLLSLQSAERIAGQYRELLAMLATADATLGLDRLEPAVRVSHAANGASAGHASSQNGAANLASGGDAAGFEALLIQVWSELLQTSEVTEQDNFFELGGHSLLALTMVSRVENACGRRLSLLRVGNSSLRALALQLAEEGSSSDAANDNDSALPVAASQGGRLRRWIGRLIGKSAE
jgi:non-ribosomal peptide synthetase component F